jgi:Acetoacetate decarboxylase (ADC)
MLFFEPEKQIKLVGRWEAICVTLQLPATDVAWMLPSGLELAKQSLASVANTHPVVLYFGTISRAHLTFPRFITGNLSYKEHIIGIPYVRATRRIRGASPDKLYFFMPRLFLTNLTATIGGRLIWGFPKVLSRITEKTLPPAYDKEPERKRFEVREFFGGERLTAVEWSHDNEAYRPAGDEVYFQDFHKELMQQPLITEQPMSIGPFFSCSDFRRNLKKAQIRPVSTKTLVRSKFLEGLEPSEYQSYGINAAPVGSFQIRSNWSLTLPRHCGRD